jgi:hypothetical protein
VPRGLHTQKRAMVRVRARMKQLQLMNAALSVGGMQVFLIQSTIYAVPALTLSWGCQNGSMVSVIRKIQTYRSYAEKNLERADELAYQARGEAMPKYRKPLLDSPWVCSCHPLSYRMIHNADEAWV